MTEEGRINVQKTPFPWFGGKADAAEHVWTALGDVDHYVEPFAGGLAVLLRRPHLANRTYHSETVNDIDGMLVNAWRSMQMSPEATAEAASWPVAEADLHARHLALVKWKAEHELEHLMGDPAWHDPVMAGWWLWGCSSWIGSGWCSGEGGWIADDSGRLIRNPNGRTRAGMSKKQRPHLGDNGRGVNHANLREPGVSRQLPHLGDNGRGVNHANLREPGVSRQLPHLGDDGRGVNRPQMREEGCGDEPDFHPMTMPELLRWMRWLSARLRHVRILNGDWKRAVTGGASKTLPVRQGGGHAGIFLDPPYAGEVRDATLYAHEDLAIAHAVREWCAANGDDPQYRIALAGFDTEHTALEAQGWRCIEWFKAGFLRGGMGNQNADGHSQKRERLWLSPHCLAAEPKFERQVSLFGVAS